MGAHALGAAAYAVKGVTLISDLQPAMGDTLWLDYWDALGERYGTVVEIRLTGPARWNARDLGLVTLLQRMRSSRIWERLAEVGNGGCRTWSTAAELERSRQPMPTAAKAAPADRSTSPRSAPKPTMMLIPIGASTNARPSPTGPK